MVKNIKNYIYCFIDTVCIEDPSRVTSATVLNSLLRKAKQRGVEGVMVYVSSSNEFELKDLIIL